MEKEDFPLFAEWANKPEVFGEYNPLFQVSKTQAEKMFEGPVTLYNATLKNTSSWANMYLDRDHHAERK